MHRLTTRQITGQAGPIDKPFSVSRLCGGGRESDITRVFFWITGISWDRNDDAGTLNRYIAHAGVGHTWADSQRRRFATSYGVSYRDRELKEPDPEKDRHFGD